MKQLAQMLIDLGLHEGEAKIFLTLTKLGKATAAKIALASGINRTTAYSILKQLMQKGLAIEDLGSPTAEYLAAPDAMTGMFGREQEVLDEKKRMAADAERELRRITQAATYEVPKIQFVPEERIERFLNERFATWNASALERDGVFWGFQEKTFVGRYQKWIDMWWRESPKEITVQLLTNDSPEESAVAARTGERRRTKFWKESVNFTATNWVIGDYIVMLVLSKEPAYLVEMHDSVFAANQRAMFRGIWEDVR